MASFNDIESIQLPGLGNKWRPIMTDNCPVNERADIQAHNKRHELTFLGFVVANMEPAGSHLRNSVLDDSASKPLPW